MVSRASPSREQGERLGRCRRGCDTGARRAPANRLRLEYATIAWNLGEAVFTIGLGIAAGSLALIGFGADSLVEVFASSVVVWYIRPGEARDRPERTRLALRLVAAAFAVLAVVLAAASIHDLPTGRRAGRRHRDRLPGRRHA